MESFKGNTRVCICCLVLGILLSTFTSSMAAKEVLSSNFAETDYAKIDTIFIRGANQRGNQVKFIDTKIFPAILRKNRFLDIGPGPGHVTERIARSFSETTVVEPIKDFEKKFREQGYITFIGNFQNITLKSTYDFILCSHVLYHVSQNEWPCFLQRIYDLLDPKGIALIVLIAPNGPWARLQLSINPNLPNSKKVEPILKKLGLQYDVFLVKSNFKTKKREDFEKVFRLFTLDNCFAPEEFNKLTAKQKLSIERKIRSYVDSCRKADGTYVANWDDAYIVVNKL
jgi:SAM-dependent methyltransferase